MTSERRTDGASECDGTTSVMKRRGILRAAGMALGAVAASLAAKQTSHPVAASTDANFAATGGNGWAFYNGGGYSHGVYVFGSTAGVQGNSTSGDGVKGTTTTGHGVFGQAGDNGTGVRGEGTTTSGVTGIATSGYGGLFSAHGTNPGVRGESDNDAGIGVQGDATTSTGFGVMGGRRGAPTVFNGSGVHGKTDGGHAVHGEAGPGWGVYGTATGPNPAIYGESGTGHGVYGTTASATSVGVYGKNTNDFGDAVRGEASTVDGTGVRGTGYYGVYASSPKYGVFGQTTGNPANAYGVYGYNPSSAAGGAGVYGTAKAGFGVYGTSSGGPGVFGTTTASQNAGLAGLVSTPGTAAFAGTSTIATAFAGFFTGDVLVNGNFTVIDPTKKHGAIAHPDGSYRLLYSMESPESWLEDFGSGKLVAGKATVTLDKDFTAVAETGDYSVFLTPEGDCNGLYVTAKSAAGFEVREVKAGSATLAFRYRVVAKPKTTNKAERLAKFTIPNIKVPGMPGVPLPILEPPTVPDAQPQAQPPARPPASATAAPASPQNNSPNPVQPIPPPRSG